jgi:hypothetical protein
MHSRELDDKLGLLLNHPEMAAWFRVCAVIEPPFLLVDTAAPSKSAKSQPLGKVKRPASGSADDFSASAVCGQFLYPSNEMVTRSCVSQPCFAVILNGEPQSLMKPHREDRPFTVIN